MVIPHPLLLGMRNLSDKNLYRKSKHTFYVQQNLIFFFRKILPFLRLRDKKYGRPRLKCDGTRAETRFRLSARNGRVHLNRPRWASVQSTAGSRGVCISGSNAGYNMFRGSVKSTGYLLHSPVSLFTSSPVRHRVPSHFNWTLQPDLP